MEDQQPIEAKGTRESGAVLHRRETNRQVYFPFLIGIAILIIALLLVGVPSDPAWRNRAQAIGDFLYTLLCIIPILFCLLPIYVMILLGIYGMSKVHDGTERPLRKLENLTASLATRIEKFAEAVNDGTISFSSTFEPFNKALSVFDPPAPQTIEENPSDERTESAGSAES